jgi:hypothetical protein
MGSIPGQVILPNYAKIASGLSRIYNTVSIQVKFIPFKIKRFIYHHYYLPQQLIQGKWHSG